MKLQEALRGMKVKNWEMRVNDRGRRVVYVRFAPKEPAITMNVNHEIHERGSGGSEVQEVQDVLNQPKPSEPT